MYVGTFVSLRQWSPPPVIGGGLLSGTWGATVHDFSQQWSLLEWNFEGKVLSSDSRSVIDSSKIGGGDYSRGDQFPGGGGDYSRGDSSRISK